MSIPHVDVHVDSHTMYMYTCMHYHSLVFRYVPEDLPEVELPNLATKKRATRKRGKTYPGDGE